MQKPKPARIAAIALLAAPGLAAQTYGLGRPAEPAEIEPWDITIGPDGRGLPPGSGTAREGAQVYEVRCKECHGDQGIGGDQAALVGEPSALRQAKPVKTVGSYWPYATTLFDYTRRAMPFEQPGTLTPDQVYAVTAYILQLNGLIGEDDAMNAETLPDVQMPNRDGFVADPRRKR